jgi:hypothetical protein
VVERDDIEGLLARRDLRSADRANLRRMLEGVKKGRPLDYQDRQNLWAYIDRYSLTGRVS